MFKLKTENEFSIPMQSHLLTDKKSNKETARELAYFEYTVSVGISNTSSFHLQNKV